MVSASAFGWQGLSLHGTPRYQNGMASFAYANAMAPKGGSITIGWMGSFDTANPFAIKGTEPLMLSEYVFESLGQSSKDETMTTYPGLAASFEVAKDLLSMRVELDKRAAFSNGEPVTTKDVAFSFDLFRSKLVRPQYQSYWADIKEIKVIDKRVFEFVFSKKNPELPLIALQLVVMPASFYGKGDFAKDFNEKALGSGPYVLERFERGSMITLKRNPQYWAAKAPFNAGRYNFDDVQVTYYKDETAQLQAFKAGEFSLYICYRAKDWAVELLGPMFKPGGIVKELWPQKNNAGTQGFFFNLRKPVFSDIALRRAIVSLFDFDWINKKLFYSQYTRNESVFENSPFKAVGVASGEMKGYLKDLKQRFSLRDDIFNEMHAPKLEKSVVLRELLKNGYSLQEGVLKKGLQPIKFTFLVDSASMQRVLEPFVKLLAGIGIKAAVQVKEPSVYQRLVDNREFDVITGRLGQSMSPGNEQKDMWTSKAADNPYTSNYAGLKNPAVDVVIEDLIYAQTQEKQIFYAQALDRLLFHEHFILHHWHLGTHRVAYWDKFASPPSFPLYYQPTERLEYMWAKK
jgi:microcin C transport system substrate-binding protein